MPAGRFATLQRRPLKRISPARGAVGFTLIEMLLVLAIVGIAAAVTIPNLVGSIRGHRLRGAARTIVMAGRYAHSMAVMKQTDMALKIDLDRSAVSVRSAEAVARPPEEETPALREPRESEPAEEAPGEAPPVVQATGAVELSRKLDQVMIKSVEIQAMDDQDEASLTSGQATIFYRSNGTCTPYEVFIEDEHGSGVKLTVDALSTAKTEIVE